MRFKTKPMAHQLEAFNQMDGRDAFALLMEQGTGKTKVVIDDVARVWGQGKIEALLVLAPNGVHTKWITIEIPKHLPDWCPYVGAFYSAGASKRHQDTIDALFEPTSQSEIKPLRILAMNYDAVNTADGKALLKKFTLCFKCYCALDESQRIKNPGALRTKEITKMRRRFPIKRIMTGTPSTRAPFDIFSQFHFLDETILRTSSFVAFKTEYAEMLPPDHWLVQKIKKSGGKAWTKKDGTQNQRIPQIVARDDDGQPIYRNLEKLNRLITPHSYRVLKKDCVDLPEKIYDKIPFELTPRQRQVYNSMENTRRAEIGDFIDEIVKSARRMGISDEQAIIDARELIVQNKISAYAKLQQITCGYLKLEDGEVVRMFKKVMDNPRNKVLMESVEDAAEGGIIFWAPHRDKIEQIIECLQEGYDATQILRYDGSVSKKDRMQAVDDFQSGAKRFFVGNPQSGGTGLTLNYAETVYYYSDSFDLEPRIQSEDRCHRIGQTKHVRYYDLVAMDTIDEVIADSQQMKKAIADVITGDDKLR